jgi:hypothetical protein
MALLACAMAVPLEQGISRANDQVHEFFLPLEDIASPTDPNSEILGPGNFRR